MTDNTQTIETEHTRIIIEPLDNNEKSSDEPQTPEESRAKYREYAIQGSKGSAVMAIGLGILQLTPRIFPSMNVEPVITLGSAYFLLMFIVSSIMATVSWVMFNHYRNQTTEPETLQ